MSKSIEEIHAYNAEHGVLETNPVTPDYHEIERETFYFEELTKQDEIVLERLRIVTDGYVPHYEVSYCHAIINGVKAEIMNFPYQIPKRGAKKFLVQECKEQGIFIKDICSMEKWSILR